MLRHLEVNIATSKISASQSTLARFPEYLLLFQKRDTVVCFYAGNLWAVIGRLEAPVELQCFFENYTHEKFIISQQKSYFYTPTSASQSKDFMLWLT